MISDQEISETSSDSGRPQPGRVSPPRINQPSGGGSIKGLGEEFAVTPFTGTATFSIPIPTTPARGFEPELTLRYESGRGNGPFGMGFRLSLPFISRRADRAIPRYDDEDEFMLAGADVLRYELGADGRPVRREENGPRGPAAVTRYVPRVESAFTRIEMIRVRETGLTYWRTFERDGTESIYGRDSAARVYDGENPHAVFQWNLEESRDPLGNRILYEYVRENDANIGESINEQGRSHHNNSYLERVLYGNYGDGLWAFEILLDYGRRDMDSENPERPLREWPARLDPFSSYRSGFEIRTHRLCRGIYMIHNVDTDGPRRRVVSAMKLEYDERPDLSFLKSVQRTGFRHTPDGYRRRSLPPLELEFSTFDPLRGDCKPLAEGSITRVTGTPNARAIPGFQNDRPFPDGDYFLVDMYGEGIPGIFYSDDQTILYRRCLGDGRYEEPVVMRSYPRPREEGLRLADLEADGRMNLIAAESQREGFHEIRDDGSWSPYRDFRGRAITDPHARTERVDVTGDGLTDLLTLGDDSVTVHRSLGKAGYGSPAARSRPRDFPAGNFAWSGEAVRFAPMLGDGLEHRVRIRNGSVECWPNLGYGKFGERILFRNAPLVDGEFDERRIYLADLDGSGAADLIYMHDDHAALYKNEAGNGFAPVVRIELPDHYDNFDQINFADTQGDGLLSLVLTKNKPEIHHIYRDFNNGTRAHLLIEIRNNLGALTRLRYESSTRFYLRDREAGIDWATRLPFPIHVVALLEEMDLISGTRIVNRYRYRHGYFDPREREFRGFGLVEKLDAESFEQYSQSVTADIALELNPPELHATPVLTRTWFHTGVMLERDLVSRQFAKEYSTPSMAEDSIIEAGDPHDLYWAYRALGGRELRVEILEPTNDETDHRLYSATEKNYHVVPRQKANDEQPAVFSVRERETIKHQYEQDPNDPRIIHEALLEANEFNLPVLTVQIAYGRKPGPDTLPEQATPAARASLHEFVPADPVNNRLGLPARLRKFELHGPPSGSPLSFDEIREFTREALRDIRTFDSRKQGTGARLLTLQEWLYWNDDQTRPLELGRAGTRGLLYKISSAVMSRELAQAAVAYESDSPNDQIAMREGGYEFREDELGGHWWNPGTTVHYDDDFFFRETRFIDQFGNASLVEYDHAALQVTAATDPLGLRTVVELDYDTLRPRLITDPNGNRMEFLYEPLGNLKLSAHHGNEESGPRGDKPLVEYDGPDPFAVADPAKVLENPELYLRGAGEYFEYDPDAFKREGVPARVIHLVREEFHDETDAKVPARILMEYSDGHGNPLQNKLRVDAGPALARDSHARLLVNEDGRLTHAHSDERWLVSGRVVHDNKGRPIKQYEPFFSSRAEFESERELARYGISAIKSYDAPGRPVRTRTAKGFLTRTIYRAWSRLEYDENDTVSDSDYYKLNTAADAPYSEDEAFALEKTLKHYDSPAESALDPLGRPVRATRILTDGRRLTARMTLDISGNEIAFHDARLRERGERANFTRVFDMEGRELIKDSADQGLRRKLFAADGNIIRGGDANGNLTKFSYDEARRLKSVRVRNPSRGLDHVTDFRVYGDELPDRGAAKTRNQLGRLMEHRHSAGVEEYPSYDLHGEPIVTLNRFRRDYKSEANWAEDVPLEEEIFETMVRRDARGRVTREKSADGTTRHLFHNRAGQTHRMRLRAADGKEHEIVRAVEFNARNQRTRIVYGNGVQYELGYEAETFRLMTAQARLGEKTIHDLKYTYDPAGNILRIQDLSARAVFNGNTRVEPAREYDYDGLYRLVSASGREHPGLDGNENDRFLSTSNPADGNRIQAYVRLFTYDDGDNLISTRHRAADSPRSWTQTIEIAPDSNRAAPEGANPANLYDENGNLRSLRTADDLVWNYRDGLQRALILWRDDGPDDAEYYAYNTAGERVRKVTETLIETGIIEIQEKLYIGAAEIKRTRRRKRDVDGPVLLERRDHHCFLGDRRVAVLHNWTVNEIGRELPRDNNQIRFRLDDHIGSGRLELDASGRLISYEEYFPYGGTALIAGPARVRVNLKEYRYSGKERDDSTGLYYYGARYYSPHLRRWLSPDPAGPADGPNLFAFVRGNPIRLADARGYCGDAMDHLDPSGGGQGGGSRGPPDSFGGRDPLTGLLTLLLAVFVFLLVTRLALNHMFAPFAPRPVARPPVRALVPVRTPKQRAMDEVVAQLRLEAPVGGRHPGVWTLNNLRGRAAELLFMKSQAIRGHSSVDFNDFFPAFRGGDIASGGALFQLKFHDLAAGRARNIAAYVSDLRRIRSDAGGLAAQLSSTNPHTGHTYLADIQARATGGELPAGVAALRPDGSSVTRAEALPHIYTHLQYPIPSDVLHDVQGAITGTVLTHAAVPYDLGNNIADLGFTTAEVRSVVERVGYR